MDRSSGYGVGPSAEPVGSARGDTTMSNLPVFVYGTLRPGQCNHDDYLAGRYRQAVPAIAPGHVMYAQDVPIVSDGDSSVTGDLIFLRSEVYDDTLRRLDRLEGTADSGGPGLYCRVIRAVLTVRSDGGGVDAWIYHATPATQQRFHGAPRVLSGDWLAHSPRGHGPCTNKR
ncbi:gamma-glutamylcyclotransferase [Streptomyces griseorubiginosus]|uniref:gamma-glutamylcyclotransferase family protein n=2 Tax=Streptomyces TaxID=1883 RepID=UPI0036DFAEEB